MHVSSNICMRSFSAYAKCKGSHNHGKIPNICDDESAGSRCSDVLSIQLKPVMYMLSSIFARKPNDSGYYYPPEAKTEVPQIPCRPGFHSCSGSPANPPCAAQAAATAPGAPASHSAARQAADTSAHRCRRRPLNAPNRACASRSRARLAPS
jgi:hypothetical protein